MIPAMVLHRGVAHGYATFSSPILNFVKIVLWSNRKYLHKNYVIWGAAHLKHHVHSDTVNDPHSPHFYSSSYLLKNGRYPLTLEEIEKYSKHVNFPRSKIDDFLEKYQYGAISVFVICLILFSYWGILCWLMLHLTRYTPPIGDILFHKFPGYRNSKTIKSDQSRNVSPIAIIGIGEELHHNHHRWPGRSNFAVRLWEFDFGYFVMKILEFFKLAKINAENRPINEEFKITFVK